MIQIPEFNVVLYETTGITELTPWIRRDSLTFGDIDPGGYGAINFDLDRDLEADNFESAAIVVVTHSATGIEACAGRLMNPGRGIDPDGNEVWKMSTLGQGQHHLQEVNTPYHLIDTRLEDGVWYQGFRNSPRFEFSNATHPDDEDLPGWYFTTPEGRGWGSGHGCSLNYYDIKQYGLAYGAKLGGFSLERDCGRATSSQILRGIVLTYDGTSANEEVLNVPWVTTPTSNTRQVTDNWAATGIGPSDDEDAVRLILRIERSGADVVEPPGALSTDWAHLSKLRVSSIRVDRNGDEIVAAGSYTAKFLLAHQVLIDAIARFADEIDLPNARIDETSVYEHKQLVWPEGINVYQLLNDHLLAFDPAYTWAVWGRQDNGLWEFEWRERSTDVRYELEAADGFERTGATNDEVHRVFYTGTNHRDLFRIGSTNDDIGGAGDPEIPVASKVLTVDSKFDDTDFNLEGFELAETTLKDSKLIASAATATVRRRVYDHKLGRYVHPWEIRSGYNARVAGVHAELDTLNDGTSDDSAIFRIVSKEYSTADKAAKLELNSFTLDERRALVELVNRSPARVLA